MARFYAEIEGSRGRATRLGTPSSGMHSHTRGWNIGASVTMRPMTESKRDCIQVDLTGGSNGAAHPSLTVTAHERKEGGVLVTVWCEGSKVEEWAFNESGYREGVCDEI